MELRLKRIALRDDYTIGKLEILYNREWKWIADTVEDKVRDINKNGEGKVFGKTAIPYGRYEITMKVQSPKYSQRASYSWCKGYLPRLMNVPHFDGILIHAGNTAKDSAGCLIVGENKIKGQVINSMATLKKLIPILNRASDNGEKIWITIE